MVLRTVRSILLGCRELKTSSSSSSSFNRRNISNFISQRARRELGGFLVSFGICWISLMSIDSAGNVSMFADILRKARETPGLIDLGQVSPLIRTIVSPSIRTIWYENI